MYLDQEIMQYFQQMSEYLHAQNKQMESMKKLIEQLNREMSEWKEKQVPTVIKNEYKFDLLKVERLEGTMNIGLNPKGNDAAIGEISVPSPPTNSSTDSTSSPAFKRVQSEIHRYLERDAYQVLKRIEDDNGYALDPAYRSFILEDVKKQIDQRILHYLGQLDTDELEPEQIEAWEQKVIQKVKRDIERTCTTFVTHMPREVDHEGA